MTPPANPPMSDERLDRLVRELLHERAEDVAATAVPTDAMLDRLEANLRPSTVKLAWVLMAAALLMALLVGTALVVGGQLRLPWEGPAPHQVDQEWAGPLSPESRSWPLIPMSENPDGWYTWTDAWDATISWIDIGQVSMGLPVGQRWGFDIGGIPPLASTLDPAKQVIEYGVVIDRNADGTADCVVGINNDTPNRGDFRVWVTGPPPRGADEQVGPPYGWPIDFSHPDEQAGNPQPRHMSFFFLSGAYPDCAMKTPTMRFYVYASLTEAGRVTAWDMAPDAGWLVQPEAGPSP